MKKVFFIIPSIETGGAEKMFLSLSENFNLEKDIDVTLISCYEKPYENVLNYSENLKVLYLNKKSTLASFFSLYRLIVTHQPDVVFSTIIHLNVMMGVIKFFCRMINTRFIARETLIPSVEYSSVLSHMFFRTMCRLTFPIMDKIIFQSEYMKSDFIKFVGDVNDSIVINNFVDDALIPKKNDLNNNYINILFVGRIVDVKQVDKTIDVLSYLPDYFRLQIIGDGPLMPSLKEYVTKKNLEQRVCFLGFSSNPYDYMKKSHALLLTSKYEGFPNAMLEALCVGIPVFTFLSPGGIHELANKVYENNIEKYCSIVNDSKDLSEKIVRYFSTGKSELNYREKVLESFSKSVILKKYLQLIR